MLYMLYLLESVASVMSLVPTAVADIHFVAVAKIWVGCGCKESSAVARMTCSCIAG